MVCLIQDIYSSVIFKCRVYTYSDTYLYFFQIFFSVFGIRPSQSVFLLNEEKYVGYIQYIQILNIAEGLNPYSRAGSPQNSRF